MFSLNIYDSFCSFVLFLLSFNAYFMLRFVVWFFFFHVWVEYLVFVFNLRSVWTNLCKQRSMKCFWNSNAPPFTQFTVVTIRWWCASVNVGMRCVYMDSARVCVQWWWPCLSCKNLSYRDEHGNTNKCINTEENLQSITLFLSAQRLEIFSLVHYSFKMEKAWADIITNSNKPLLRKYNHGHFCTV